MITPRDIPSANAFWNTEPSEQFKILHTSIDGLTSEEVLRRRIKYGPNQLSQASNTAAIKLFANQFKSPITLLLIGAAILSYFLHDQTDGAIIMVIVLISSMLGFWQERSAGNAVSKLLSMVQIRTSVLRDRAWIEIPMGEIVPGDIVKLSAGDSVPADCLLVESNELFADEAAFTGETFPVEKKVGIVSVDSPMAKRT